MDIYVLRHGVATARHLLEQEDSLRPLTAKGIKEMRTVAEGMKALGLAFDVILTSSYVRAHRTAKIVAKVLGSEKKLKESSLLLPNEDPEALLQELKKYSSSVTSLLVVGHEPFLSAFIATLLIGETNLLITLKKGGLCKLSLDQFSPGKATLEWLLTPKQLMRM